MEKVYETIQCIKIAFPNGIDDVYHDLIVCLKHDFTPQNLATLLAFLSRKSPTMILNDILHSNEEAYSSTVMEELIRAGYKKS